MLDFHVPKNSAVGLCCPCVRKIPKHSGNLRVSDNRQGFKPGAFYWVPVPASRRMPGTGRGRRWTG